MARRRKARVVANLAARAAPRARAAGPAAAPVRRLPGSNRQSVKRRPRAKPRAKPRESPRSRPSPIRSTSSPSPSPLLHQFFALLSLPPELTLLIASFLRPRTVLAMLLTSPAFAHLSSIFVKLSRQDYEVTEHRCVHVYTPLQFFCSRGIESVVRRLLREGADPNAVSYGKPKNQLPPLIHAIGFHSASIVSLLLQHGADVHASHGYSALEIAVGQPHQIYPPLLPDRQQYTGRRGQLVQIVQLLLDAGADVTSLNPRRGTVLHVACIARNGDPGIVAALLAAGADVHCKYTPHDRMVARLLDGDIQPLHCAVSAGNAAIVQLLLDAGADIEATTRAGLRPLDNAVVSGCKDIVVVLHAAGADMCVRDLGVNTASGRRTEVQRLVSDTIAFRNVTDPWYLSGGAPWDKVASWLVLRGSIPGRHGVIARYVPSGGVPENASSEWED